MESFTRLATQISERDNVYAGLPLASEADVAEAARAGERAMFAVLDNHRYLAPQNPRERWEWPRLVLPDLFTRIEADQQSRTGQNERGWTSSFAVRGDVPAHFGAGWNPADLAAFDGRFVYTQVNPSDGTKMEELAKFFKAHFRDFGYTWLQDLGRLAQRLCSAGVCLNATPAYHAAPSKSHALSAAEREFENRAGLTAYAAEFKHAGESVDTATARLSLPWDGETREVQDKFIEIGCGRLAPPQLLHPAPPQELPPDERTD
jgi:hypothetical protein